MRYHTKISPKHLALVLGVPCYLFSDLPFVSGELLEDGRVKVDDPSTLVINGILLAGKLPEYPQDSAMFIPTGFSASAG
jgi:hypothetical protein